MGAFEDYERFTEEREEQHSEDLYSCDACGDRGCPKCDPDLAVAKVQAAAVDCILTGAPFGGAR